MDLSTSACSALHYALEEFSRLRGRPPKTWLSIMKQQLRSKLNMNWNEAFDMAKDESVWKTFIKDCPMWQKFYVDATSILMLPSRRARAFICDIGQEFFSSIKDIYIRGCVSLFRK